MAILGPTEVARLREAFWAADYSIDSAMAAIGEAGREDLARNHTIAAERALAGRDDALATMIRLFILQLPQPTQRVATALPLADLRAAGLLVASGDDVRASVDVRPYGGDDGTSGWVVSDHTATLNTARGRPRPDHVLGLSPASISLAQLTPRRPVGRALDLGTGCGVQSLHLARHADRVIATDVNPRALDLAAITFALNDLDIDLRSGSLYDPVAQERFDLIATNPPFVIAPPGRRRLVYREGTDPGDGLMRRVVSEAAGHLAPGGVLTVLGNWAHTPGATWQERLAEWIPSGCDAVIIERELLDLYNYIEIWLADAGLTGTRSYRAEYDRWLAYYDALGYDAIGLGWIELVHSGRRDPSIECLEWPYPVRQPVADDLIAHLSAVDWSRWPDSEILATRWVLADDAYQEIIQPAGGANPTHITLRRTRGLPTYICPDTELAGTLGACDGDLTLGAIIDAVAALTDNDPAALTTRLLLEFRGLIATAWVTPTDRA
jgi:SAM-dependent methyltransferase